MEAAEAQRGIRNGEITTATTELETQQGVVDGINTDIGTQEGIRDTNEAAANSAYDDAVAELITLNANLVTEEATLATKQATLDGLNEQKALDDAAMAGALFEQAGFAFDEATNRRDAAWAEYEEAQTDKWDAEIALEDA